MSFYVCYLISITKTSDISFNRPPYLLRVLWNSFFNLESLSTATSVSFDRYRDQFRRTLFDINANAFPISGQVDACLADVLATVCPASMVYEFTVQPCSANCLYCKDSLQISLPTVIVVEESHSVSLQEYMLTWLASQFPATRHNHPLFHHGNCPDIAREASAEGVRLEPLRNVEQSHAECQSLLIFELHPIECWALPDLFIELPSLSGICRYRLAAIIYHGNNHFAARIILPDQTLWKYDGQLNGGTPVSEGLWAAAEPVSLTRWNSMTAHMYLYVHDEKPVSHHATNNCL